MHEFENFETQKFVSRLLGKGDWSGFIDKVKDAIPEVSWESTSLFLLFLLWFAKSIDIIDKAKDVIPEVSRESF
jgi:hypothetical protein